MTHPACSWLDRDSAAFLGATDWVGCEPNDGYSPCVDIDECSSVSNPNGTAECLNFFGGYVCIPTLIESSILLDGKPLVHVQDGSGSSSGNNLLLNNTVGGMTLSMRIQWVAAAAGILPTPSAAGSVPDDLVHTITYGPYQCSNLTITTVAMAPPSSGIYLMSCITSSGVGTRMHLSVTLTLYDVWSYTMPYTNATFSYAAPVIVPLSLTLLGGASTLGYLNIDRQSTSAAVQFRYADFLAADRIQVWAGNTARPRLFACTSVSTTNGVLACTVTGGVGTWLTFSVSVTRSTVDDPMATGSDTINFITTAYLTHVASIGCDSDDTGVVNITHCPTVGGPMIKLSGWCR